MEKTTLGPRKGEQGGAEVVPILRPLLLRSSVLCFLGTFREIQVPRRKDETQVTAHVQCDR